MVGVGLMREGVESVMLWWEESRDSVARPRTGTVMLRVSES